jgi:predicted ABC-type ATPase
MESKRLYIIAGCNGAGKTTASFNILPNILNCREFVNADEIARGLSPFQPEMVGIEAGRIMLKRIDELLDSKQDFSFETTLATKSFVHTVSKAQIKGYFVILIFIWLESPELAKDRVRKRVAEGGHNIDSEVIERRYRAGIKNLFEIYCNKVDSLLVYDNSSIESELICEKELQNDFVIHNAAKFESLKSISS